MPFNHQINKPAPLPTGALPTDFELSQLRQKAYIAQGEALRRAIKRLVRMGKD